MNKTQKALKYIAKAQIYSDLAKANYSNFLQLDYIEEEKKGKKEVDKFNEFTSKLDEVSKEIFLKYYYYIYGIKETMNNLNISYQDINKKLKGILKLYCKCFDEIKRF